jgi:thymidylate synthase (FAD)
MLHNLLQFKDNPIKVLDQGSVMLIDVMGTDQDIVNAARISYGEGTKRVLEDRNLIRYLMRHKHWTPFEMLELKIRLRIPMDAWRQMVRHRTFNINEYSTRYSLAIDDCQETMPEAWRLQSKDNKQGSSGLLDPEQGSYLSQRENELQTLARAVYEERIDKGVAREQARKDLPLSTYTEAYVKCDLRNWFNFLQLRMDSHAQEEIRMYANAIASIIKEWVPLAWEAFEDYCLEAQYYSKQENEFIKACVKQCIESGNVPNLEGISRREEKEFYEKLGIKA